MAKSPTTKKATPPAPKKAASKASTTGRVTKASAAIDQVAEQVLGKLRTLNLEHGLQNDIEWCLGSYRHDQNPSGLYEMVARALPVLQEAKKKQARAIPATLLTSITKVLASK